MKNATRTMVATFGLIGGLFGVEHGVGFMLQGNVAAPTGAMIPAWPDSRLFDIIGGEPAMTVIPNLLITGILAIVVSSAVAVWSWRFASRKFGGPVLILLSLLQLLTGGGISPIVQLILMGLAALKINSAFKRLRKLPAVVLRASARAWPWIFGAGVGSCLLLFPGSIVLGRLWSGLPAGLIAGFANFFVLFLVLTIAAAFLHDAAVVESRGA